jgi:hypothetical protein
MDYHFRVRALDNSGVSDSSKLETTDLEEAILTTKSLLLESYKKWVIVATMDDEEKE